MRHGDDERLRRGGADRSLRRVGRVGARVRRGARGRARRRPVRARRDLRPAAARAVRRARNAIDAALHDLQGKLLGLPVHRLLGLRRAGPPTSWTIWLGDPDDMARRAEKTTRAGRFRRLKLKLGGRDGLDVERVRAVRGVTDLPLQVDVNEYWSLDEALEYLPQLDAPVLRAAAAGRRSRRARAQAPRRRFRSSSTRTATRSPTSPPAPSARTGSTSSWPSPAGSARRSAWRTRRARSGSA